MTEESSTRRPRRARIYVMDVRVGDMINFRADGHMQTVFRVRNMRPGVVEISTTGGGSETRREIADTRQVWIEIP